MSQARTLKAKGPLHNRVSLQVLADEFHVNVRTLRAAAHDGRLAALTAQPDGSVAVTLTSGREYVVAFTSPGG